MPTINQQQIANQLSISRTTVSRCFTNHPGINPETRASVFSLAARMGYTHAERRRPTASHARADAEIGALVCVDLPNFEHTRYGNPGQEILNGLAEFARGHDARLDLHFVRAGESSFESPSYAAALRRRRRWRGIVLIYPFPENIVAELARRHACVSLVEQYGATPLNCVDVDHDRGVGQVMEHLLGLGHRRIGFFTWHYPAPASWAQHRYNAYAGKLAAAGLPVRPDDVVNIGPQASPDLAAAYARVRRQTNAGVTAWLCAADHQAYDLLEYLQNHGLRAPQDVSVTGFDGIAVPAGAPVLSTVKIPFRQIGLTGGKRLFELMQKRFEPVQHILLDCQFRSGATTGRPSKKR